MIIAYVELAVQIGKAGYKWRTGLYGSGIRAGGPHRLARKQDRRDTKGKRNSNPKLRRIN